jgi:predicted unusual protein kinase regulating ubiquinone biosynthesis (AarF/ABC1/UbiB family)
MAFEDYLLSNPSQEERDRDGRTLFEFYFGSLYRYGLFHADPHPGNYVFRPGGTIVIYDFGCTRVFDRHTTAVFAHLAHAVRDDDISEIRSALEEFGATPPTRPKDFARLHKLLRGFFGPFLVAGPHAMEAGVTMEAGEIMRDKMALMRLHLPGKLLFLFRIRFGMYAVLARLGSVCDWAALEAELSQGLGGGKAKT